MNPHKSALSSLRTASSVIASRPSPVIASEARQSRGKIRYYLSNDGGKNWQETKLNEKIDFRTKGNDFRFKVELDPDADMSQAPRNSASIPANNVIRANPPLNFTTPWLNLISVEYYSKP